MRRKHASVFHESGHSAVAQCRMAFTCLLSDTSGSEGIIRPLELRRCPKDFCTTEFDRETARDEGIAAAAVKGREVALPPVAAMLSAS